MMVGMDLRLLRYFLAVVEHGTVTAAADDLRIAQPSISRQLKQLERDLGLTLFTRSGQRLSITAEGQAFVPVARDLLQRADWARAAAGLLAGGSVARLVIAAPGVTVTEVIGPFLATLEPDRDPLVLATEVVPSQAITALEHGADLAISARPARAPYTGRTVVRIPLRAYVAPTHHWARRASVTLAELVTHRLLVPTRNQTTRTVLDLAVAAAGLTYDDVIECEAPRAIQGLSRAGFGIGVVTDLPRFGAHSLSILDPGPNHPLSLELHAAWHPDHYAVGTIEDLAQRIGRFASVEFGTSTR